ncbi:hypothetical protein OG906_31955 [Streptomyces sp. NBC_01426]|uniref:hypothetical protein n=1 Tax=unclassified Streptomyces TaxID=2593676 RepID=UPI002E3663B1|nr:hypothetical protein [Streptomyces sp. NBC_01426]
MAAGPALAAPLAVASPAAAAPAGGSSGIELPCPTGAFAVGRDTLHLVDRERKGPWVPTADRELLLSLYYPALAHTGTPAPYLAVPEAKALLTDRGQLGEHVTPERLAASVGTSWRRWTTRTSRTAPSSPAGACSRARPVSRSFPADHCIGSPTGGPATFRSSWTVSPDRAPRGGTPG